MPRLYPRCAPMVLKEVDQGRLNAGVTKQLYPELQRFTTAKGGASADLLRTSLAAQGRSHPKTKKFFRYSITPLCRSSVSNMGLLVNMEIHKRQSISPGPSCHSVNPNVPISDIAASSHRQHEICFDCWSFYKPLGCSLGGIFHQPPQAQGWIRSSDDLF